MNAPAPIRRTGLRAAALLAALAMAGPAAAQEEDLPLDMGTPVEEGRSAEETPMGESYLLEVSGDWLVGCIRTSLEHDPCALTQVLEDENGNETATIEIFNFPQGREAAAGATILTPLETLLNRQITMSVDGGPRRQYEFSYCTQAGCYSRVGFTAAEVDQFRRGAVAQLTIFAAVAPETPITLNVSLIGFTDGYAQIEELNALYAEAVTEARAAQAATENGGADTTEGDSTTAE